MTDLNPISDDDLVRHALRAEAEHVTAGPELLDRIRAKTVGTNRSRRRPSWLLMAAVLTLVAGLATVLVAGDDGAQRVDVINDPAPTSPKPPTTEPVDPAELMPIEFPCQGGEQLSLAVYLQPTVGEGDRASIGSLLDDDARVATVRYVGSEETYQRFKELFADSPGLVATVTPEILPTAFVVSLASPTDETDLRSEIADRPGVYALVGIRCDRSSSERVLPAVVVLVREDGRLVSVDLSGGDERELAFLGDPREDVTGANTINSVSLSPDGSTVYFASCCPPDSRQGDIWRVPVDGSSEARRVAAGSDLAADPSGNWLAIADPAGGVLSVITTQGDVRHQLEASMAVAEPDWSPDGRRLAFTGGVDAGEVMIVDFDQETGFSGLRRLPGVTDDPVWLDNDELMALDRSGADDQIVRLTIDGAELDRGSFGTSVRDLAASHDRRAVLAVNDDGSVVVQYAAGAPGAGFGAFASNALAADW